MANGINVGDKLVLHFPSGNKWDHVVTAVTTRYVFLRRTYRYTDANKVQQMRAIKSQLSWAQLTDYVRSGALDVVRRNETDDNDTE